MEIQMTISELNQVKSHKFTGQSVINCSLNKLKETCLQALTMIDDSEQRSAETENTEAMGVFSQWYTEIEEVYFHLKEGGLLSLNTRNQLRLTLKNVYKYIQTFTYF